MHAAKIEKNTFLGAPFFAKDRFSGDFRGPAGRHFELKSAKNLKDARHFFDTKTRADDGSVQRAVPEASRSDSGGSGHPPKAVFERIFDYF